ncbi:MAG: CBS domain-containing protein [Nitrospinota bacterium]|jgi:acetoin utilization protein AcuB|nr:CBS domain-containing protein [Nitrospinota bacterium]
MKVKDLMSKKLFTVGPEDMLDKVFFLFNFEAIRHLPVVEKGKVVGVISDRDMKKIMGARKKIVTEKVDGTQFTVHARRVRTLMDRGVTTIGPDDQAADAAAIMAKRKIGCLPVVKKDKLVGMITSTDILRAYVKLAHEVDKMFKNLDR